MKPESIQYLFECYLKEKQDYSPQYDAVDGISYARRAPQRLESLAAESGGMQDDRCSELLYLMPENGLPYAPHHAPLEPHQEEIARALGRQLSQLSDGYETDRSDSRSRSSSDASGKFQFQTPCLFASRKDDKVEIKIYRLENCDQAASLAWKTKDRTAQAGVHYEEASGTILFNKGEASKVIEIKLLKNHNDKDICFLVELLNSNGVEIGLNNPVTVNITDHENLYDDERQVVENIVESRKFSLANVKSCLLDKVTVNTFKTALMYACSHADSVPLELAYAFELLRFAMPVARRETLMRVICNFFRTAPELEEMERYVENCYKSSDDESDEDSDSD